MEPASLTAPSGALGSRTALIAVFALLAVPVIVVLTGAVSHHVRNRSTGSIISSGIEREYVLHVPTGYDPAKPTPLIISLHGGALWGAAQRDISRWTDVADREGFLVVFPSSHSDGGPGGWSAMPGENMGMDVRFIADLIDTLSVAYNIDSMRVYADGLSNGGGMAFVLSCMLSDRIAAVGLVASAQMLPWEWCRDRRPVPMIAFHGTADPEVPYAGGKTWVSPYTFPNIPAWVARWARRNGCAKGPIERRIASDVTRFEYTACANGADVVLNRVEQGGHTWPGGGPIPAWLAGAKSHGVSASNELWAFYRAHPLAASRGP